MSDYRAKAPGLDSPRGLGTVCVEDSDCKHVELSVCLQGVCACGRDRLPAASGLNCVPLAKSEMDECEEDSQCSYNLDKAYCKDSKCVCQPFNHIVAGKCVPIKVAVFSGAVWVVPTKSEHDTTGHGTYTCPQLMSLVSDPWLFEPRSYMQLEDASNVRSETSETFAFATLSTAGHPGIKLVLGLQTTDSVLVEHCGTIPLSTLKQRSALGDSCSINDECRKPEEENDSVRRGCLDNKCACVKGKQEQDLCTSGCGSPTESWQTIGGLVVTLLLANMIAN
ncbi:hypothetical protein AAG570_003321 [Ranatra chinensis]|uniref:EB domain-containing protein n=1 Tax=Ranatra chinensis TaxID=642074 RepID=A0ABD0YIU6_9HEMI